MRCGSFKYPVQVFMFVAVQLLISTPVFFGLRTSKPNELWEKDRTLYAAGLIGLSWAFLGEYADIFPLNVLLITACSVLMGGVAFWNLTHMSDETLITWFSILGLCWIIACFWACVTDTDLTSIGQAGMFVMLIISLVLIIPIGDFSRDKLPPSVDPLFAAVFAISYFVRIASLLQRAMQHKSVDSAPENSLLLAFKIALHIIPAVIVPATVFNF